MNLTILAMAMKDNAVIIKYLADAFLYIVFCLLVICTKKRGTCEWDLELTGVSNPQIHFNIN